MSGSEGGGIEANRCFLPLYLLTEQRHALNSRAVNRELNFQPTIVLYARHPT